MHCFLHTSFFAMVLTAMMGVIAVPMVHAVTNTIPVITTQPVNKTVVSGGAVTFSIVASGTPAPTYQWLKGGVNITGATSASYTIASVAVGDAGSFTVIATNVAGSVTSNAAVLTVQWAPTISTQPVSQTVVPAQNAAFTVGATGNPAPSYQWQKLSAGGSSWSNLTDGGSYLGTGTVTLQVSAATLAMNGDQFRCVATNSAGSIISSAATLSALIPTAWARS